MTAINRENLTNQITQDIERQGHSIIEKFQINNRFYNKDSCSICFISKQNEYYSFIEPDVKYNGNDKLVSSVFTPEIKKGWRQLLIPPSADINFILTNVLSILGVDNKEPAVIWMEQLRNNTKKTNSNAQPVHTRSIKADKHADEIDKNKISIGEDLVKLAEEGKLDEPFGRDDIIDSIIQVVSKSKKNACILLGEPGVGKTAVIEGLALRIYKQTVPATLLDKRIYSINMGYIAAESEYYNQLLSRIKSIVNEAKRNDRVILFIDEAHMLADPKHDVSQILKADLGRDLRVIAATTNKEYQKYIAPDEAFARRFQRIPVPELSPEVCLQVLQKAKTKYEKHHNINIPDELLPWIIKSSIRYVKDEFFLIKLWIY